MRRLPVSGVGDRVRLAGFFARLAVKEHLAPRLHVRPLVAELFLTDNCNLNCISCACWRTVTRRELDGDEWRGVIDQIAALGILKANFTGGEPLLRRDAPELMAYARDAGIRSLHVNTNAILLDDRRLGAVLDAGVRSFNVSGRRSGRRAARPDPR
jgi:MoaA/NifB/PqqE/SkfB family radical SAM enzyme